MAPYGIIETSMDELVIYHNPRCSKSRRTLELLTERGLEPRVVEYLKTPPTLAEIHDLLSRLGRTAREIMRKGEEPYTSLGLADVDDESTLVRAIHDNPILLERPIVVAGDRARIGRPPESVLEIL